MTQTGASILVVDDDVDTCQNLADILSEFGYQVDVAHGGRPALDLIRRKAYDLALLDLKMPDMDGLSLYREIKRLRAGMVAMIISAHASRETMNEAATAGAWKFLAKPVDLSTLMPLINEAVSQPFVLVVDDDPALCENLWDLLRERGYRVSLAHDEPQAAAIVRDESHLVVLIDMKLPRGDGRSVLQVVRQANPEARVILMTSHGQELQTLIEQSLAEGADAICYKPFDIPELLSTVERLTQRDQPSP